VDRPWLKYPLLLFALGVILKVSVLVYGFQYQPLDQLTRLIGLPLFLIASVFLGVYFQRDDEPSILENAKRGMKSGMVFTLAIALFSFLFYGAMDPDYYEGLNEERVKRLKERKAEAERNEKVEDPLPDQTVADYRKELKKVQETWQGPLAIMTVNLLVYTFLTIVSSLLIAVIERVLMRRQKPST
jgi:hypothetical protein